MTYTINLKCTVKDPHPARKWAWRRIECKSEDLAELGEEGWRLDYPQDNCYLYEPRGELKMSMRMPKREFTKRKGTFRVY